jgi:hypothetical protein
MDKAIYSTAFTDRELHKLSCCRLYLGVTLLSDICNIQGTHLLPSVLWGYEDDLNPVKGFQARQARPSAKSWLLWRQLLRSFASSTGTLYGPLGE